MPTETPLTPEPARCPNCGALLPAQAPQGLCPKCLFAGLAGPTEEGMEGTSRLPLHTPEELAPHFPQLEIMECLGRGGMGVVYKVRQKSLNRFAALKLLAPERVADAKFAQRFAREAQALAALSHPHIVTIYDFGQAGGFYFLLMEYVDGVNLRQAMKAGRFTPEQALAVVPPVCGALQYAHDHGIVHRDIKPENLLLDKEGRVKIADFGIAKMLGDEAAAADGAPPSSAPDGGTLTSVAGTPQYMAPEQKAHGRTDHRTDIYSLGVVLYELLTGELPEDKLQPPSRKVQIDVRLDEIVLRALERTPELRYQTAGEFRTQLETMDSPSAPQPPLPSGISTAGEGTGALSPHAPRPRRSRLVFALFALVSLAVIGLGGLAAIWWTYTGFKRQPPPEIGIAVDSPPVVTPYTFGPVVEFVLEPKPPGGFRLETGSFVEYDHPKAGENEPWLDRNWHEEAGVDVAAAYPDRYQGMRVGFTGAFARTDNAAWDQTPDKVIEAVLAAHPGLARPGRPAHPVTRLSAYGSVPEMVNATGLLQAPMYEYLAMPAEESGAVKTCLVRPRHGGLALVQISRASEGQGIKIRGKFIRQKTNDTSGDPAREAEKPVAGSTTPAEGTADLLEVKAQERKVADLRLQLELIQKLKPEELPQAFRAMNMEDPAVARTLDRLQQCQVELEGLVASGMGESQPQVASLRAQITVLRAQLQAALGGLHDGLRNLYAMESKKLEDMVVESRTARGGVTPEVKAQERKVADLRLQMELLQKLKPMELPWAFRMMNRAEDATATKTVDLLQQYQVDMEGLLASGIGESHPRVATLRAQITILRTQLETTVDGLRSGLANLYAMESKKLEDMKLEPALRKTAPVEVISDVKKQEGKVSDLRLQLELIQKIKPEELPQALRMMDMGDDPAVAKTMERIQQCQMEMERLVASGVKEDQPEVASLRAQINLLRVQLRASLDGLRSGLNNRFIMESKKLEDMKAEARPPQP